MGILRVWLLIIVFLLPLIPASNNFGYEQIKVLFFIVSITLIAFVWMGRGLKWTGISKAAGVFILVLFLTSLTGIDPKISLLGTQPYFQGVILYTYLFLFFLLVSTSKIKFDHWACALVGSATIVGLLAIGDFLRINLLDHQLPTYAGRVVSTFGQPNFYAGFLLLSLPLSYLLFKKGHQWIILIMIISILGIFVSYSRTAIFLALILLILGLIDQLKIKKILIAVLLVFMAASGFIRKEFFKPLSTANPDLTKESVENRVYIWPQALKIGLIRPLAGYGLENISLAFSDYFEKNKHFIFEENLNIEPVLISLKDLNIDRSHNYILDLLLFSGIFGTGVWIILIVLLIKKCKNKYLLTGLLTYLIWIQFQNQSIVHLVYFWLLVGMIDGGKNI